MGPSRRRKDSAGGEKRAETLRIHSADRDGVGKHPHREKAQRKCKAISPGHTGGPPGQFETQVPSPCQLN